MGKDSNFVVTRLRKDEIHLIDVGPHDKHLTCINDAERIVKLMGKAYRMSNDTKLFVTLDGETTEFLHEDREFKGFQDIEQENTNA